MRHTPWQRTATELSTAIQTWLQELSPHWPGGPGGPGVDSLTSTFCRTRVAALANAQVLQAKLDGDLGPRDWRPLGHVLAVVSENDHLGVVAAMAAAALTGNRLTLKARRHPAELASLRLALGWTDAHCRIADWDSQAQTDEDVLRGIDAVLMAGGAELISHYRRAAAPGMRLIEYGPRLSAAWIQTWPQDGPAQTQCLQGLLHDTVLFQQGVCSSPQLVLLPDAESAAQLFEALELSLKALPPLPEPVRLQQMVKCQELRMLQRLGVDARVAHDGTSGWAVSLTPWDLALTLPRGFRLLVGDAALLDQHVPGLQTLGVWPPMAHWRAQTQALHCCTLGRMHQRSLLAPHDGHWELAQWVRFVSSDFGRPTGFDDDAAIQPQ